MRHLVLFGLTATFACAPSAVPPQLESTRQAFSMIPEFTGPTTGAQLGRTLTACPGPQRSFVAGAPGTGTVLLTADGGTFPAQGNQLGRAVSCTTEVFAASTTGLQRVVNASWSLVSPNATLSLATSEFDATLPLLSGETGSVRFLNPATGLDVATPIASTATGFGGAVAWARDAPRFAVGSPASGRVDVYDYSNGSVTFRFPITSVEVEFGRAIVFGNVSPSPGSEIIVASRGKVQVFDQNGGFLWYVSRAAIGFGASLAIEANYAPGLDALWIGDTTGNQVERFIGTTGSPRTGPIAGIGFGAGLAINNRMVAVGAPDYPTVTDRRGAVFLQDLGFSAVFGEVQNCLAGSNCQTSACEVGTCVGDVFCQTSSNPPSACLPEDFCVQGTCVMPDGGLYPDAGTSDAGTVDAGYPNPDAGTPDADAGAPDAGAPDAGAPDAGQAELDAGLRDAGTPPRDAGSIDAEAPESPDAGALPEVSFAAGCSHSGAWPSMFLALWLCRRARRGEPSPPPMT